MKETKIAIVKIKKNSYSLSVVKIETTSSLL